MAWGLRLVGDARRRRVTVHHDVVHAVAAHVAAVVAVAGDRSGGVAVNVHDLVAAVHVHDLRLHLAGLGVGHAHVADDDHEVAGLHEPGRGAVDADDAGATRARNDVGLQPGAVVDV